MRKNKLKPSERIKEIAENNPKSIYFRMDKDSSYCPDKVTLALIQYLDEINEKK